MVSTTTADSRDTPAPHIAAIAWVGLAGIGGFVLSTFALLLVEPEKSAIGEPISYYVHGHHGWLLTLGLLALGIGALALSVGVAQCVQTRAGPRGLAIFGLGVVFAGLFPADPWWPWERATSMSAMIHGSAACIAMLAFAGTAIPLMRALRTDARWDRIEKLFYLTAAAGVIGIVGCIVSVSARLAPQFLGMMERIMIGAGVAWLGLIAVGLIYTPAVATRR